MDAILSPCRRRLLGAIGGAGALALAGCGERVRLPSQSDAGWRFAGETMGTTYQVKIAGARLAAAQAERLAADVHSALDGVNRGMTLYRADSELMRFNRHRATAALPLSKELFDVLAVGQQVAVLSGGAFDVSVAPLVAAWGFGPEKRQIVPADEQLRAGRAAVDFRSLRLDAASRTAAKATSGLEADLGGIAKGYGLDLAARAIEASGIGHYMIEVGGEVLARGHNASGRPWRIGIEEPDAVPQRARLVVALDGKAMATSGDYRIYFEAQGRRYSHEIDPRTAAPIAHGLASVTVIAADCVHADALATALIVLGPQAGWRLAERERIAAHFIARGADGRLHDRSSTAFTALMVA